jgi:choice-of-anchor A domain-containing protein
MNLTRLGVIVALGLAGTLGVAAQSYLSIYDVVVRNDFSTSTDVRGSVVAKNFTATNGGPLAQDLSSATAGTDTVFIQNSIAASGSALTIQYGGLAFGGASVPGRTISYNQGGNATHFNTSFNFDAVFNGVVGESSAYAALTANSTASLGGNNLTFTVGVGLPAVGGTAVFNVDAATLGDGGISQYNLDLNGKSPSSIIVNIIGTEGYSFSRPGGANFTGNFTSSSWYQRILWNFTGAGAVSYGAGWKGSILAPNASVTSTGDLDGSLAAYNATLQGEVHLPNWTGAVVPEPSTYAAGGVIAMLAGSAWLRAQKRRNG